MPEIALLFYLRYRFADSGSRRTGNTWGGCRELPRQQRKCGTVPASRRKRAKKRAEYNIE
jgi:hypothetical protein